MATLAKTLVVRCPKCDRDLEVPIVWDASKVRRSGEVRLIPVPDLSVVKTHLVLHLPPHPDGGLPIAS